MLREKQYNVKVHGFAIEVPLEPRSKKVRVENARVGLVREAARQAGVLKRSSRLRSKQSK